MALFEVAQHVVNSSANISASRSISRWSVAWDQGVGRWSPRLGTMGGKGGSVFTGEIDRAHQVRGMCVARGAGLGTFAFAEVCE
eukprot:1139715-Pelagomonas_calceolata.AAC.1